MTGMLLGRIWQLSTLAHTPALNLVLKDEINEKEHGLRARGKYDDLTLLHFFSHTLNLIDMEIKMKKLFDHEKTYCISNVFKVHRMGTKNIRTHSKKICRK